MKKFYNFLINNGAYIGIFLWIATAFAIISGIVER